MMSQEAQTIPNKGLKKNNNNDNNNDNDYSYIIYHYYHYYYYYYYFYYYYYSCKYAGDSLPCLLLSSDNIINIAREKRYVVSRI